MTHLCMNTTTSSNFAYTVHTHVNIQQPALCKARPGPVLHVTVVFPPSAWLNVHVVNTYTYAPTLPARLDTRTYPLCPPQFPLPGLLPAPPRSSLSSTPSLTPPVTFLRATPALSGVHERAAGTEITYPDVKTNNQRACTLPRICTFS